MSSRLAIVADGDENPPCASVGECLGQAFSLPSSLCGPDAACLPSLLELPTLSGI